VTVVSGVRSLINPLKCVGDWAEAPMLVVSVTPMIAALSKTNHVDPRLMSISLSGLLLMRHFLLERMLQGTAHNRVRVRLNG